MSRKFIKEKCLFYGLVFQFYSQALFMTKIKKELDMVKHTRSHKIQQYRNELWEYFNFLICNTSKDKPYRLDALHILKAERCRSLVYRYESLLQYKSIFYQPPGKKTITPTITYLEKKLHNLNKPLILSISNPKMHALAHGTVHIFVVRPRDGVINHIKTCFTDLHMVASKQNQY